MKKIMGLCLVSNSIMEKFYSDVVDNIKELENDKQEVEVQYSMSNDTFSALIIGRKEE